MTTASFEPAKGFSALTRHRALLGESPVYDAQRDLVWWVDITGKALLRTDLKKGDTDIWQTPEQIGFVALTSGPLVIAGLETGLFLFDPSTGSFEKCAGLPGEGIRFNDATTDARGRLWAGTMDIDNRRPVGKLYRIDRGLEMTEILSGLMTINGLAVDDESGRLYLSDSTPSVQKVWVMDFDLETGHAGQRRLFVDMAAHAGRPDGAALDAEGNYWLAGVEGGVLHVFTRDAAHLAEIRTPVDNPTKPGFVGRDLTSLCLTSKGGEAPNGALMIATDLLVAGRTVQPFDLG